MSQIFTGARALIKINGVVIGFASGIDVNQDNTLTDVDVLGQLSSADLAETGHKCDFTVNYFKQVGAADVSDPLESTNHGSLNDIFSSANVTGIDTSHTNTSKKGMVESNLASMRSQVYFDCEIIDDITNLTVYKMVHCKFAGGTGRVDSRGVYTGSWKFRALKGFGI